MILLRANQELRQTFDKLIETMKVPVKWNGIFVVIDNYIILQGEVRSLFFHFDSRKVITNIIDIPLKEDEVQETGSSVQVRNVINMILYVFGKWGTINGLKVEKNYVQLNQLFGSILQEIQIEPQYNQEHFRFFKDGIQVTYEDVIQYALEHVEEETQTKEEEGGLWHKIIWKKEQCEFIHVETTLEERLKDRVGNNFYMVGYLCPVCHNKMHMVVYPEGKEFRIETEEGAVLLARAATCVSCSSFYTPRPDKLFSEGDVYALPFEEDKKAYEDYLELMGKRGERGSNHNFNRFLDAKQSTEHQQKLQEKEDIEELEKFCGDVSGHSKVELERMRARMEENFYPEDGIRRLEQKIKAYYGENDMQKEKDVPKEEGAFGEENEKTAAIAQKQETQKPQEGQTNIEQKEGLHQTEGTKQITAEQEDLPQEDAEQEKTPQEIALQQKLQEKYEAKLNISNRFSKRQLKELAEQLERDTRLDKEVQKEYIKRVREQLVKSQVQELEQKVVAVESKPYPLMKRVYEEIEKEELPKEEKTPLLERLRGCMQVQGEQEVRQLMEKMPPHMNREKYRAFVEKIHSYEEIDLAPYEERLKNSRKLAEEQEVEDMVKRARKISREDYEELSKRLLQGDFLPELILPYQEKINEKIRQIDADEIAKICLNPMEMTFAEGLEAYQKIDDGNFLPELKADALRMLSKRLSKIKTDECELLVKKIQSQLAEAGIQNNEKHYFYPARKVLLEQALPEETAVIDYALAAYAAGIGLFEYPIFVVDTSRNGSGKEGMILTPEHLYYSTMLTSYGISIASIEKITASTGLLNRGLYVHQGNGEKLKIPYAVDYKKLVSYAFVLDDFVKYLQEKPESRKVDYLAKEKHETICCFRCGNVYKGGVVCPKCGYKNNE